jgi:hypothetical protein
MADAFYVRAARFGSWPRIGLMLAGCIACRVAFILRGHIILLGAQCDPGTVPDARLWYTPPKLVEYFRAIGERGRDLYASTQLTLDTLFPCLYGTMLCCLVARVCAPGLARRAIWLPIGAACCDLIENVLLAFLAWQFDGAPSDVGWLAAGATATKWLLLGVAGLALGVGTIGLAVAWIRGPRTID